MRRDDDLERFVEAQQGVYADVLAELTAGRKASHWMWFIFPQLRGLGRSATARYYGIASAEEARAYLGHPVLGTRLSECTSLVLALDGRSLNAIFGSPDDMKFRSSMTLFDHVAPRDPVFRHALDKYCGGAADPMTLDLLGHPA